MPDLHLSRPVAARTEAEESQVDLLVARIEGAYDSAGRPGAIAAVRELLRRAGPTALTSMIGKGIATEPLTDEDDEEGRENLDRS